MPCHTDHDGRPGLAGNGHTGKDISKYLGGEPSDLVSVSVER